MTMLSFFMACKQHAPCIAYNLLDVEQLMKSTYSILFDDDSGSIYNKRNCKNFFFQITNNSMFPLNVFVKNENCALVAINNAVGKLWHLRCSYLNIKRLKLFGMPKIEALVFCKGCAYVKQCRSSFPISKAWRATNGVSQR